MESIELDNLSTFLSLFRLDNLMLLFFGILTIYLLTKGIQRVSLRLQHTYPTRRVIILQVATIISFFLYILGVTLLLCVVIRPPKEILLAVGGSAAVAIGIALKDIVASLVAGVILLFDRPFQVGDRVSFGEVYGEIVGIGLRTVKLQTLDDNLVTIPNARFLTDVVASGNSGALDMMVVIDFHIDLQGDIQEAQRIVREIVTTSRFVYLKKPVSVLTSEVEVAYTLAIRLRAKAYVLDCRFEKAFETDVVNRVQKIFREKGINRPQFTASARPTPQIV